MPLTPRLSKFMLTSHITFSVGWFGAVAVFLALAITGMISENPQLARSAYLMMELSGWFVIVPFCFASLLTGLIQSLGTRWGLFRHYWIIVKLILTIAATIVLLLHMKPISHIAGIAAEAPLLSTELPGLQMQLIADAGAALIVLLAIITISVYKPWGRTRYGRVNHEQYSRRQVKGTSKRSWGFYILIGLISLILLFIIMHLLGGGMGGH